MKTILVTGAASGIGRAVASQIIKEENSTSRVFAVDRDHAGLRRLETECSTQRLRPLAVDLTSTEQRTELLEELQEELSTITGMVLSASIHRFNLGEGGDQWEEVMQTNLHASYHLVTAFLKELETTAKPALDNIVLLSSAAARKPVPEAMAYSVSKAATEALTVNLAAYLSNRGIRVNAVAPGWVDTPMSQQVVAQIAAIKKVDTAKVWTSFKRQSLLGGISSSEEIATLIRHLLDGTYPSMTGQVLHIDQGVVI